MLIYNWISAIIIDMALKDSKLSTRQRDNAIKLYYNKYIDDIQGGSDIEKELPLFLYASS